MTTPKNNAAVLTDPEDVRQVLRELCDWSEHLYMAYAWATSEKGKAEHWRSLDISKVRRAAIGVSFARTEPNALRKLATRRGVLRVNSGKRTDPLFHPKVIVGCKGGLGRALVGSSNFTAGGFSKNTELNVLLDGQVDDEPIRSLLQFIEREWSAARRLEADDEEWFNWYEAWHKQEKKTQPRPPKKKQPPQQPSVVDESDLNISWDEYFRLVSAQHGDRRPPDADEPIYVFPQGDGNSYLEEIEACVAAFRRWPRFSSMPEAVRHRILGFPGGDSWGYLGRMRGAHRARVMEQSRLISRYLSHIPLEGDVTRDDLARYLHIWKGSDESVDKIGMATATRLLSVKRPDLFFSLNTRGNVPGIRRVFGHAPFATEGYIRLSERIWSLPWYNSEEPKDPLEARVWAARVAMLDALVYLLP